MQVPEQVALKMGDAKKKRAVMNFYFYMWRKADRDWGKATITESESASTSSAKAPEEVDTLQANYRPLQGR